MTRFVRYCWKCNFNYFFVVENAKPCSILLAMINEAKEIRENQSYKAIAIEELRKVHGLGNEVEDSDDDNNKTLKGDRTLVPDKDDTSGTMIMHEDPGTLVPDHGTVTELQSDLGTMVINSDFEESTMKRKLHKIPNFTLSISNTRIISFRS